ncbi:MAG: helix-turn-helix domain-containing protein [Alphaproteobacteria bacterium]|nr:helix-turn-helix domain-containing protein [Alphaproteobacteria bacterium]
MAIHLRDCESVERESIASKDLNTEKQLRDTCGVCQLPLKAGHKFENDLNGVLQRHRLLSTKEAARILGVAPGTLANQRVSGGGLPFLEIGGRRHYLSCVLNCEALGFSDTLKELAPFKKALLDTQRVASFLGLSKKTLQNWRSKGEGPKVALQNVRGLIRYQLGDLLAFLEQRERTSTSERGGAHD